MPENLEEAWIDYESGLVTEPGCAAEVVSVVVPRGTVLERMRGCRSPALDLFTKRVRDWWRLLTD
jgi:hypothetical protein